MSDSSSAGDAPSVTARFRCMRQRVAALVVAAGADDAASKQREASKR